MSERNGLQRPIYAKEAESFCSGIEATKNSFKRKELLPRRRMDGILVRTDYNCHRRRGSKINQKIIQLSSSYRSHSTNNSDPCFTTSILQFHFVNCVSLPPLPSEYNQPLRYPVCLIYLQFITFLLLLLLLFSLYHSHTLQPLSFTHDCLCTRVTVIL